MRYQDPRDGGPRSAPAGQQHDDSTLFSLHSLMKQGATPREEAAPDRNESGLIDLAALAAMHEKRAESPKLDVAPFAGVELFQAPEKAPEPLPPPVEQAPAGSRRWKTMALLAGAVTAVVAASAVAVAIAATHGAGDAQLPPVAALHITTAPVSTPPEPPRAETPKPVEARSAEVTATPPPASSQAPSRHGPRRPGPVVVKPDPPKPAAPCDLMCQMQKSVAHPR